MTRAKDALRRASRSEKCGFRAPATSDRAGALPGYSVDDELTLWREAGRF